METMLALVKDKAEPGIWLREVPIPVIGPDDVLIKIRKTAICGTDIHIDRWDDWARRTVPLGLTIGHEFVGEIAAVGSAIHGLKVGERVSGEGHIVCGICRNCLAGRRHLCRDTKGVGVSRPGAFAEYLAIPATNVWHDAYGSHGIADDIVCCFDPLGNATHTALAFDVIGEDVLITGAGPIGLMAAAICRHVGARYVVITDLNDYRLELARGLGVTRAVNVRETGLAQVMKELGMQEGFNVGLETSGSPQALAEMVDTMYHGGSIALLGIPEGAGQVDWRKVVFNGLVIRGIYGRQMYETWYKMVTMLESGLDIAPVITHRLPAREYAEGFAIMRSGQSGKVILDWSQIR